MRLSPRAQRWALLLITLLAIGRGSYWAAATLTPSPVDELQHFDYVRSIARLEGIPTVGEDRAADEVLRFAKESPTLFFRSFPYPSDLDAPVWDETAAAQSYEGIQGPTYYAALAPFYWAGRPWGVSGSWFAARLGSVLLAAMVVPLSWLLTRRLVPRRPEAWLLPPLLLAFVNSVNAGTAPLGNDAIVLSGSAATAVLVLRALDRRSWVGALGAGAVAGLVIVGKTTALAMVPVIALLAWAPLVAWWREDRASALRGIGAAAVGAGVPVALWLAWNLHAYGAISGAEAVDEITGQHQLTYPTSLDTLRKHWQSVRPGFWHSQIVGDLGYQRLWEIGGFVVLGLALVVAFRRRRNRPDELRAVAWGAAAHVVTFAVVAGLFLLVLGDTGLILGRYIWVALVPVMIALGVACRVIAPPRLALTLVLVLLALTSWQERGMAHGVLRRDFEQGLPGNGRAPVVEQSYSDGFARATGVRILAPCQATALELGLGEPPQELVVLTADGPVRGTRVQTADAGFSRYELQRAVVGTIEVPVETEVAVSRREVEAAGALIGERVGDEGDPMLRVHCAVSDPGAARFEQLYDPGHPPIGRAALFAWPTAWAGVTAAAAAAAAVWAALEPISRRRSASPSASASATDDDADAVR